MVSPFSSLAKKNQSVREILHQVKSSYNPSLWGRYADRGSRTSLNKDAFKVLLVRRLQNTGCGNDSQWKFVVSISQIHGQRKQNFRITIYIIFLKTLLKSGLFFVLRNVHHANLMLFCLFLIVLMFILKTQLFMSAPSNISLKLLTFLAVFPAKWCSYVLKILTMSFVFIYSYPFSCLPLRLFSQLALWISRINRLKIPIS